MFKIVLIENQILLVINTAVNFDQPSKKRVKIFIEVHPIYAEIQKQTRFFASLENFHYTIP